MTTTEMTVWVATSQACQVTVGVFDGYPVTSTETSRPVDDAAEGPTVRVGDALHIAVVTVALPSGAADHLYSYTVGLQPDGGAATDIAALGMLDAGTASDATYGGLGYAGGNYPSFRTPPASRSDLKVVHGSCFKMHGNGKSMLDALDDLVQDGLTSDRPHLLLLTGDQIYADDVATALLPVLTNLGQRLHGGDHADQVPLADDHWLEVTQPNFPAGRRQKLVREIGGLTSDDCDNHLIGFFEFAAMYLLTWTGKAAYPHDGAALWPDELAWGDGADTTPQPVDRLVALSPTTVDDTTPADLLTPLFDLEGADRLKDLQHRFIADRKAVEEVRDNGDSVRRALANVPVLTICDDHEVTDDWFITQAWKERVLGLPLGRAIIRNALLAYVLFQGWGNTPEAFAQPGSPERALLDHVPAVFPSGGGPPDRRVLAEVDALLGLDGPADVAVGASRSRCTYDYSLVLAGGRLVVLDTRTHREYGSPNGPPGLLSGLALDNQLSEHDAESAPWLIVVSPAPVIGPRLLEEIVVPNATRAFDLVYMGLRKSQQSRAAIGYDARNPIGELWFDTESWGARPVAFERLLARLTRCPQVVVLAGDVHYAASYELDYRRYDTALQPQPGAFDPGPARTSRVVQFTSSAIRNAYPPTVTALVAGVSVFEHLERLGFADPDIDESALVPGRLGWSTRLPDPIVTGSFVDEARPMSARLFREPVVLPVDGWLTDHPTARAPEWGYAIRPIRDTRTDTDRFTDDDHQPYPTRPTTLVDDQSDPAPGPAFSITTDAPYPIAANVHAADIRSGLMTRTLVFNNNLGIVDFPDDRTVRMRLRYRRAYSDPAHPEKPHDYVEHQAGLVAADLPLPGGLVAGRIPTGAAHGP